MNISKLIYDYLMEYNTPVVVPDLGCFSIVNIPSEIRDGKVIPPFKTVKLDSENTGNDGVFTSYIARKENITIEQAADNIRNFYHQNFISKLPKTKIIVIEKFGTFSLNEVNNIVFDPDPEFFNDNYGLDYAFFSVNTNQQPQEVSVAPEPPPFVSEPPPFAPEPPPFVPEPEFVFTPDPEPVFSSEPSQPNPKPEDSLFDTNDSSRFRENTSRTKRSPMFEKKEPTLKTPKTKTPPVPKKQKQKTNTNSSNMWVLWVLLAAAGLGVAGYYFYPTIYPMLFSTKTTVTTLADLEKEPINTEEPDENIPNTELAQTLDEGTDKKNALNPDASKPTEVQTSQSSTPVQSSPPKTQSPAPVQSTPPKTESKPPSNTQSQTNVGQGRYVLIIASFRARSEAERFGKRLPDGMSFEIVPAMVNGAQWNRVSVGSFDTRDEATRQADQIRSRPYCQDVWVAKR